MQFAPFKLLSFNSQLVQFNQRSAALGGCARVSALVRPQTWTGWGYPRRLLPPAACGDYEQHEHKNCLRFVDKIFATRRRAPADGSLRWCRSWKSKHCNWVFICNCIGVYVCHSESTVDGRVTLREMQIFREEHDFIDCGGLRTRALCHALILGWTWTLVGALQLAYDTWCSWWRLPFERLSTVLWGTETGA